MWLVRNVGYPRVRRLPFAALLVCHLFSSFRRTVEEFVDLPVPKVVQELVKEHISERIVEQIVVVPVLLNWEDIVKVVSLIPQKQISEKTCEQNVEDAVPQVVKQINEVPNTSSQDRILQRATMSAFGRWQETESEGYVSAFGRWQETESEGYVSAWKALHCRHLRFDANGNEAKMSLFGTSECLKGVVNRS